MSDTQMRWPRMHSRQTKKGASVCYARALSWWLQHPKHMQREPSSCGRDLAYFVRQMSTDWAVPSARFAKMRYRPAGSPFVLQL